MRIISDRERLSSYIIKYDLGRIFDEAILKEAQLRFYKAEEFILEAETELEYYYLLVDGKVKVYYPFENGKSMFLKFYQAFNTLGDMELLKNIPILCSVEALEDAYLIAVPSAVLRREYLKNVKFLYHLVESLSEKLYATINNSSYNYIYPLVNRLSSYLIERTTGCGYIVLDSTFEEIAQFLGTTYRHLNRTFNELESESIIKCENKTVFILDEARLRELAKNTYVKSV